MVTFIGEPAVDDGGPLHEFFRLLMLGIKKDARVTFIGEPAVDDGGPLHEFFRLLMLGIKKDASLFCGSENEKSLTRSVLALQRKECCYVGKSSVLPCPCHMAAMSLSYGLQNHCETPVYRANYFSMSDVPNYEIREKLENIFFQEHNNYSCTFISIVVYSFNVNM